MKALIFILFSLFFAIINCIFTYFAWKTSKSKIVKYVPVSISLVGALYFGIGPRIFAFHHGITVGLTFVFLGIFFGISFIGSSVTLIFINIIKNNKKL